MIRFGAVLSVVLAAIGLLAGGVLASSLLLVYLAIGVAALAGLMLIVGVVVWRDEVFGRAARRTTAEPAEAGLPWLEPAPPEPAVPEPAIPEPAAPETVRLGQVLPEAVLLEPVGDAGQPAVPGSAAESAKTEPGDAESGHAGPADAEPADAEPADAEPADAEPAVAESAEPETTGAEAAKAETTGAEAAEVETTGAEAAKAEASVAEPAKPETTVAEPARLAPAKTEPGRTEPAQPTEPAETAPARPARPGRDRTVAAGLEPASSRPAAGNGVAEPARSEAAQPAAAGWFIKPARTAAPSAPVPVPRESGLSAAPWRAEDHARTDAAARAPDSGPAAEQQVQVVPGITRYHRDGCILIRFLGPDDLETMTRARAEATGCVPCKACKPDRPVSELAAS